MSSALAAEHLMQMMKDTVSTRALEQGTRGLGSAAGGEREAAASSEKGGARVSTFPPGA